MKGPGREEKMLVHLARLARAQANDLQTHLANLEAGKASAEASIDWLFQAVRAEEAENDRNNSAIVDLARFLEGAAAKRQALEATRDTLTAEIQTARETLNDAFLELKKLEHLIELNRRTAAKRDLKAETAAADDTAILRRARRGAA